MPHGRLAAPGGLPDGTLRCVPVPMKPPLLVRAIPALFIFIWSSGYVVAKFGLPYASPLTFLCLRYALVVAFMGTLAWILRATWPRTGLEATHIAIAGILMQAGYLGGVWCAIKLRMPAGVAALIVNTQPILTAILSRSIGERVSARQWVGLVFGLVGVGLVVASKMSIGHLDALPVALCVFALLAMTIGVLYQKRYCPHFDLRSGQVIQFAASLAVTLPLALTLEDNSVTWSGEFIASLAWSVLVLSGGGISLLFLMIRRGAATQVTSYLYLVPPVTALMAWLMFHEQLDLTSLIGMAVTVIAVALVVRATPGTVKAAPDTNVLEMRE
jgi:drug/metabolite transporter (DMT)-like permease